MDGWGMGADCQMRSIGRVISAVDFLTAECAENAERLRSSNSQVRRFIDSEAVWPIIKGCACILFVCHPPAYSTHSAAMRLASRGLSHENSATLAFFLLTKQLLTDSQTRRRNFIYTLRLRRFSAELFVGKISEAVVFSI
jgi:hypothetical protein